MKTVTVLGETYRDVISGFEGVCTGKATYITACDQSCLKPRTLNKDGDPRDGQWFDDTQIEIVPTSVRLQLDTSPVDGAGHEPSTAEVDCGES